MYGANTDAGSDNANDRETISQVTSAKLYVPVVTLSTKDHVNLTKQLNKGYKRSVYWNEYKSKIEAKTADNYNVTRFVLAFENTENGDKKVESDSQENISYQE